MSEEKITLLPDKLAERKDQIKSRLYIVARDRFQLMSKVEKLDEETVSLESRYGEIERMEAVWKEHATLEKAREGDGKANDDSQKGK